ncbi:MAG: 2-dehydro-3-deoxygluconokinase [Chloroflexota bacterium]|nr:2-dehydro-3-deoxygluconokinase [Chloroflexota bacterium]
MTEVVALGECLIAFVATAPGPLAEATAFERFVAGAEANVAVGLTRLGHTVAFIGRVGTDGFGLAIERRLRGEGVDIRGLMSDPGAPTGLVFRERRSLGPAQVIYARRDSAGSRLTAGDVELAAAKGLFEGARWLHVTGITPALSADARTATARAVKLAKLAGMTVSLDLNLRRRLWSDQAAAPVLRQFAARSDVIVGSPDELAAVTGQTATDDPVELARAAIELGPSIAIVKLGPGGAIALERERMDVPIARPAVPLRAVVDPIGAGDAFCAGFIAACLEGVDLGTALEMANACGAAAASALGDQTGLPDRTELAAILRAVTDSGATDTIR